MSLQVNPIQSVDQSVKGYKDKSIESPQQEKSVETEAPTQTSPESANLFDTFAAAGITFLNDTSNAAHQSKAGCCSGGCCSGG
ncbi:hypothetical protein HOG98_08510 [bacterium]|jgi:hypothetical protein|nr:hypothetical protein [bacterium]